MSTKHNYFLAFWCRTGFEALEDITKYQDWDKNQLFNIIADKSKQACPMNSMITYMTLRMRFNPQREYELYAFMTDPNIQKETLKEWADNDPQSMVDWIRANGVKVASDKNHILAEPTVIA